MAKRIGRGTAPSKMQQVAEQIAQSESNKIVAVNQAHLAPPFGHSVPQFIRGMAHISYQRHEIEFVLKSHTSMAQHPDKLVAIQVREGVAGKGAFAKFDTAQCELLKKLASNAPAPSESATAVRRVRKTPSPKGEGDATPERKSSRAKAKS